LPRETLALRPVRSKLLRKPAVLDQNRALLFAVKSMSEMAMTSSGTRPPDADGHEEFHDSRGALPVEQILSIENVAETFGISQWLLRYCEFRGLIKRRNRIGSNWTYSWADCDRIAFIIKCRRAGLRFSEIAPVVQAVDHDSARIHESGQDLCTNLIQKLEAQRKAIDEALSELGHTQSLLSAKCGNEPLAGRS
jgi:DNA-binding transcriptional MerR regulator